MVEKWVHLTELLMVGQTEEKKADWMADWKVEMMEKQKEMQKAV
jgi:hypothetical protein